MTTGGSSDRSGRNRLHAGRTSRSRQAITLVLTAALIAGLGIASNHLSWQVDLTAGQSLTLSDTTISIVAHVHGPTEITAFLLRSDAGRADAASLLSRYHRLNYRIGFRVLDPTEAPGEARQADIDPTFGGVIVTMSGRTEHAPSASEQDITGALARLVRNRTTTACFAAGHGEPASDDPAPAGAATFAGLLIANGYRVTAADLLASTTVPSSCDALIVVNPTGALGTAQDAIACYLAAGGRALILSDPASTVDLSPLLQPYGMTVVHGLVLEGGADADLPGDPLTLIIRTYPSSSPVVRLLPPSVWPTAEAVLANPAPDRGLSVATIAQSTSLSFLSRRPADTQTRFDPAVDLRGPVPLAAAADLASNDRGRVRHTRVVGLGDSDLATNAAIGEAGNSRLLVQALDWLTLDDDVVSVNTHIPAYRPLVLTSARLGYLRLVTAGAVPLLFILAGAVVWAWRRRR